MTNPTTTTAEMTQGEFIARFVAYIVKMAWFSHFDDGVSVEDYAKEVAVLYWDEPHQREDGPEECARADMSYWGED